MILKNARIFDPFFTMEKGDIEIENGLIKNIGTNLSGSEEIDLSGLTVMPGFVDIHIHGCNGFDCTDGKKESVCGMSRFLAKRGVTSFCPATMTLPVDRIRQSLSYISGAMGNEPGARILGVNLEGPFISKEKKGAQDEKNIIPPDFDLLREFCTTAPVMLCDVAPETEGACEFISHAKELCTVSAAHTAGNYAQIKAGIDAGINHMTHLYNAMSPVTSRQPGAVGAALDSDGVFCELICDGIHISPATLRITFKVLGDDRACVISDCMMAGGMADGEYVLGGQKVLVNQGAATLEDGTIAGSTTDLFTEFGNLISFGISPLSALRACSINPAKSIGRDKEIGSLEVGKKADIIVTDKGFEKLIYTFVGGRKV